MDIQTIISAITKGGIVIMATVSSFAFPPPEISPEGNAAVNWKNVLTFFAGLISIILFGYLKKNGKIRLRTMIILGCCLLVTIACYEVLFTHYSVPGLDNTRCVISLAAVRPDVAEQDRYWKAHSQTPTESMVKAFRNSPLKIWNGEDLYGQYYGMILLYLGIIIFFSMILVFVSDLILQQ